eukprot:4289678-Prymnesium_polylepis.1
MLRVEQAPGRATYLSQAFLEHALQYSQESLKAHAPELAKRAEQLKSSVSKIFGAGKVIPNAELASAWQKQRADVVRGLHTGLFFIGHDCRPMCSVSFLSSLPLVSTLSSTAPSEASSSTDLAIKKEQASGLPHRLAFEQAEEGRRCKVNGCRWRGSTGRCRCSICIGTGMQCKVVDDAEATSWNKHMQWCNKEGDKVIKALDTVIVLDGVSKTEFTQRNKTAQDLAEHYLSQ